ncbi:MAG: M1 family metallopeptidase [Clostridiales bacterium]|nr:M1 family metallopeptidase [Clostridiales bacterium]
MRKTFLSFMLASVVLSGAACQAKSETTSHDASQKLNIAIPRASSEDEENNKTNGKDSAQEDDTDDEGVLAAGHTDSDKIKNKIGRLKSQNNVSIKFDDISKSISVDHRLTYINYTGAAQNEIYFNLIPQAFADKGGGIEVNSVRVGGKEVELKQVNGTVYSLTLPTTLEEELYIEINMSYTVKIPSMAGRFGYEGNTYNLGNALITPAIFENGSWLCQPYTDIGDAFYTDIADYRVTIDVPDGYLVASTGRLCQGEYAADDVRDFAFTISSDLEFLCEEYEDIAINVFFPKTYVNCGEHVLEVAKKALSYFNSLLGGYPYDTLNLVCTASPAGTGCMEYPGLVMLTVDPETKDALIKDNTSEDQMYLANMLTCSTAHGIAHQWFYGIIGNDEIRYPWIDEGMCLFFEGLYCEHFNEGQDEYTFFEAFKNEDQGVYDEYSGKVDGDFSIDLNDTIYDYQSHPEEYGEVYYKGAALIFHMYQEMGEDAFFEAIKDYVKAFAYEEVDPIDFRNFWITKGDFSELFEVYMKDF